jgi:hypothetical protein
VKSIAHRRLLSQRLTGSPFEQPDEAVRWLVAVQAQDYAGAKWALGLRLQAAADLEVEQAFTEGAILRTHLMRPTWHFVTPADIRWMLALTAPRVNAANTPYYRKLELDQTLFSRSSAALVKALAGGQQKTREELRAALEGAGVPTRGELRMSYLMMRAELDGIVCSGPRLGKQFTYMLLDERAPKGQTLEREQALAELALRYFMSRGPATVHDFAKWSGLTLADTRRGLEEVQAQLLHEVVDGRSYWSSPSLPTEIDASPGAHLLSIYDEYISGYKDRSAIGNAEDAAKLIALGNALNYVIIVDGQIVGAWKRAFKKDAVAIELNIFTPLTETGNSAVAEAAERYGKFLNLPVALA